MEAIKEIVAVMGAIIGVLTGFVTLYAKYLDLKKKAALLARQSAPAVVLQGPAQPADFEEPPYVEIAPDPRRTARAQQMVRVPAIGLMAAGAFGLIFNLLTAGYGFVDEFVTPLSSETSVRHAARSAAMPSYEMNPPVADTERASTLLTIVFLLSISLASAGAIWSGYSMLNLRSYWLSVAGSFAVMPGACFCFLAGFPVGIWSLVVLLNPEVSASFR